MVALLASLALFSAAWLLHLAWWRASPPRRHITALLCLFCAVPPAAALAWLALPLQVVPAPGEIPATLSLYFGAAACYLILYTGVEQTSPTLVIVRVLERERQNGCTSADLANLITEDLFVRPRLDALVADGLLLRAPDGWSLTPRGCRAARVACALAAFFRIRNNA